LVKRIEKMGIEPGMIPGFMRTLLNVILNEPQPDRLGVNDRLHLLGWDGFEMDEHTLQLALACFEAEGLKDLENKSARWFESRFLPQTSSVNG
ncbi:MAG: hypothetical protein ABII06_10775, partial [Pseudomonadota bacterium]